MSIQRYEGNGRMSKAVVFNNTIYLCGQTCGEGDIKEQTAGVLAKIEDLLSITVYVKDMKDFADMNSVYDAWVVDGHEPARACVEAKMAREQLLVEMSVVAAVK